MENVKTSGDPRIERAQTTICLRLPFYAYLMLRLTFVRNDEVGTFATDGKRIYYSVPFMDTLTQAEIAGVVLHEVIHCAFGHTWRFDGFSVSHDRANYAMDYITNELCSEAISKVGAEVALPPAALRNSKFDGMSIEQVYSLLTPDDMPTFPKGSQEAQDAIDGNGPAFPGDIGGLRSSESELSEEEKSTHGSDAWTRSLSEAAMTTSQTQGYVPGRCSQLLEEYGDTSIPWNDVAQNFMRDNCIPDYSPLAADKQYSNHGLFVMGIDDDLVESVVMVWDTSGSILNSTLETCFAEAKALAVAGVVENVYILQVDSKVQKVDKITADSPFPDREIGGRGGTRFEPAFEWVEAQRLDAACLVYITDGYGTCDVPQPSYPVMWFVCEGGTDTFPFGQVMYLPDNQK